MDIYNQAQFAFAQVSYIVVVDVDSIVVVAGLVAQILALLNMDYIVVVDIVVDTVAVAVAVVVVGFVVAVILNYVV